MKSLHYEQQSQDDNGQNIEMSSEQVNYPYQLPQSNNQDDKSLDQLQFAGFNERKGFIKKVFGILTQQLLITLLFSYLAYYSPSFRSQLIDQDTGMPTILFDLAVVISIAIEVIMLCNLNLMRKVPSNYIALSIFTFSFSIIVAGTCASCFDQFENGGEIAFAASLLTFAATVALTFYAHNTTNDFTIRGGMMWVFCVTLLVTCLIGMIIQNAIWYLLICSLFVLLYGWYLIYDLQLIIGGRVHQLNIDDYVIACLFIYIDIVVLFLRLLRILSILFCKHK